MYDSITSFAFALPRRTANAVAVAQTAETVSQLVTSELIERATPYVQTFALVAGLVAASVAKWVGARVLLGLMLLVLFVIKTVQDRKAIAYTVLCYVFSVDRPWSAHRLAQPVAAVIALQSYFVEVQSGYRVMAARFHRVVEIHLLGA